MIYYLSIQIHSNLFIRHTARKKIIQIRNVTGTVKTPYPLTPGKGRGTVVNMGSTVTKAIVIIMTCVCFSIPTTVNLLLPAPVYYGWVTVKEYTHGGGGRSQR